MNKREIISGAATYAAMGVKPAFGGGFAELAAAKKWFKEAQFGMMAHWGLYSLLGGEWKGRRGSHEYGEWIMHGEKIPNAEYERLAKAFNPILFDPKDWMKRARDAGMKYFVFTSKHHDGFAMYRSKVSKYNVVDATPYGRDVVEEIAEACRATGIRLGLYYSQDLDWHEPDGGGRFIEGEWNYGKRMWGNDWDRPSAENYDFGRFFSEKAIPQINEILTQYGDLCLIWFDMPMTLNRAQSEEIAALVRQRQPGCLISGRIGHDLGDYYTPGDNAIAKSTEPDRLYESCGTMNDSWGYRPTDVNYKSVETIRRIVAKNREIGSNYLLNVSPDPLGRLPVACNRILDGLAENV